MYVCKCSITLITPTSPTLSDDSGFFVSASFPSRAEDVWKVARYTSAAPVFFKECDNYIDGGVIANNPCNHALAHIKLHLRELKEKQKARYVGHVWNGLCTKVPAHALGLHDRHSCIMISLIQLK